MDNNILNIFEKWQGFKPWGLLLKQQKCTLYVICSEGARNCSCTWAPQGRTSGSCLGHGLVLNLPVLEKRGLRGSFSPEARVRAKHTN